MTIKDNLNQYDDASPVRGNIDIQPMNSCYPRVSYRKYSLLGVLVTGLAAIGVGFIVSCTVMIIYGMKSLGGETKGISWLMEDAVRLVPTIRESLSPALSDFLNDRRRPDYRSQLEITARTQLSGDSSGKLQTVVTVVNKGEEIISLLSLRVAVISSSGRIIAESTEFAATPVAGRGYWRGLLAPGSTRHFSCSYTSAILIPSLDTSTTEVEITDIRIWDAAKQSWPVVETECPEQS